MATTTFRLVDKSDTKHKIAGSSKKKSNSSTEKTNNTPYNNAQLESFKQGLKEAIAISKGESEGNPISTLWDE